MATPGAPAPGAALIERGFWDYVTPGAGGMEKYREADFALLLDDMASARMNSLAVCVKWLTTGYRSKLPFLDQLPGGPVIESDNELLRRVIREASERGIRVWLSAVVSHNPVRTWGGSPCETMDGMCGFPMPETIGVYDADSEHFAERAVAIFSEIVELFPGVAGLMVEMENSGRSAPHRAAPYNAWAAERGAPPFETLGHPLNPRLWEFPAWRDYATWRRLEILDAIDRAVRARGFAGDLGMICETASSDYEVCQEVNLRMFRERFPGAVALAYEYDKSVRRHSMMETCIETPRRLGLRTYYLPRGVMTWESSWPMPIALEESWRRDVEDIRAYRPEGVWWFGSGAVNSGCHVDPVRLRQSGFPDGVAARRALLKTVGSLA